jgi:hypothetical protein
MNSQNLRILEHLRIRTITPLEALKYAGCWRLGARIYDLRQEGHRIDTEIVHVWNRRGERKRVARYRLVKEKK